MGFDCAAYDFTSPDSRSLFYYCPNFWLAIFFTIIFGLSTLTHIFQAFYYRKVRLCWVIIIGAAWEATAFGLRTAATQNPLSDALGIWSTFLTVLSPLLVKTFIYMIFGRMVHYYLVEKKVFGIQAKRLTIIFASLDMISFLVQLVGAYMVGTPHTDPNASEQDKINSARTKQTGYHILKGGIALHVPWIIVFSIFVWRFKMKAVKEKAREQHTERQTNWRCLLTILYISLTMIMIRNIFRLIQFSSSDNSKVMTIEAFFYILDGSPVAIACIAWNAFHPGRYLVGPGSEFSNEKGALKANKRAEKQWKLEAASH
ncbi:hypothetical protein ABW20_dc0109774 [Dactylellina cionopaga]|nr:hypothetical protein ABW20_dc0109774 [Dactylellina cionopaga]